MKKRNHREKVGSGIEPQEDGQRLIRLVKSSPGGSFPTQEAFDEDLPLPFDRSEPQAVRMFFLEDGRES